MASLRLGPTPTPRAAQKEIQARSDQLKEEFSTDDQVGARKPGNGLAHEEAEMALQERLLKDKLAAVDLRAMELEKVAKRCGKLTTWEDLVDTQLGIR